MKKALALCGASILALALPACTSDSRVSDLPPGHYERDVKSVDSNDVETKQSTSTNVSYDQNGNKKAVVDTETTRDPPGLFNKTTTESHEEVDQ